VKAGDSVKLSVTLKNSGKLRGDEVVQVYMKRIDTSANEPIRSLVEFKRVTLAPGETSQIAFTLSPGSFSKNDNGKKKILPGRFEIVVGGGQPGRNGKALTSILNIQ
jgi:beta-glucosidase